MTMTERAKVFKDGKLVTVEYKFLTTRKLRRQDLKRQQGNNKIHNSWVKEQIRRNPEMKKYYVLIAKGPAAHNRRRLLNALSRGYAR